MPMKRSLSLTFLLLLALLAACTPTPGAAAQTPTPIRPAAGFGGIVGQVSGIPGGWEQQPLQLYAAPFLNSGGGQGIFMLEPDVHPSTEVAGSGFFQVNDVPPGEYVLVVGPSPEEARLLVDDQQQTEVATVNANQVLDLGALNISE